MSAKPLDPALFLPDPVTRGVRYTIISVDDHVVEPPHVFERYLPKALRERGPRIVETPEGHEVWAFDLEWVPDVASGRRAYRLGPGVSDADVLQEMWRQGGADADNPRPYLKTVLCRIVSIAAVVRKRPEHGPVTLTLHSLPLPGSEACAEADIINAWVCEGVKCLAPITEPGQLRETLNAPKIAGYAPTPNRSA